MTLDINEYANDSRFNFYEQVKCPAISRTTGLTLSYGDGSGSNEEDLGLNRYSHLPIYNFRYTYYGLHKSTNEPSTNPSLLAGIAQQ